MADKRLVIIDDLKPLLNELEYTIQSVDCLQVVAKGMSGKEAIEIAKETAFDLMLLDIEMEDATAGIKAAREIINENPLAQVAFLSAHDTKETILSAMSTGAIDYIVKGLSDESLIEQIHLILAGRPALDNRIQNLLLHEYKRLRNAEHQLLDVMNKIKKLTTAETEIIHLLLLGKSQRQIAETRHVELVTIKTQISSILRKFEEKKSKKVIKLIKDLDLQNLFE